MQMQLTKDHLQVKFISLSSPADYPSAKSINIQFNNSHTMPTCKSATLNKNRQIKLHCKNTVL